VKHFSHTQGETFRRCPRSWWLRYGKGIVERKPDYLIEGSILHKAIQRYHEHLRQTGNDSDLSAVEGVTRQAFFDYAHELGPDSLVDLQQVVWTYADSHEFHPDTWAGIEWRMERALGDGLPPFLGVLDLVTLDEAGAVTIVDFKSSRVIRAADERPAQSAQLQAYAWLVMGAYPQAEVGVQLDFIRHRWRTERQVISREEAEAAGRDLVAHCKLVAELEQQAAQADKPERLFTRLQGPACAGCTVRWACLRERHFPKTLRPDTPEQVQRLARKTIALEALVKDYKAALKALVEEQGPVDVDGTRWDNWQTLRPVADVEEFAAACEREGLPFPWRAVQFDSYALKRRWFEGQGYAPLYDAIAQDKPSRPRFDHRPIPEEASGDAGEGQEQAQA